MNRAYLPLSAMLLVAASSGCSQGGHWNVELSSSAVSAGDGRTSRLEIQAGQTTVVQLMVVGAPAGDVSFGSANLPAFATMRGGELKLSPARRDAGDYDFTLTATVGAESQSIVVELVVQRSNAPPSWSEAYLFADDTGFRRDCLSPTTCTAQGTARLIGLPVCDVDGDGIVIDVEVVLRGEPFKKVPTHTAAIAPGYSQGPAHDCASASVSLTGLQVEQSYDFAIRVSDDLGAVANLPLADSDGWLHRDFFGFDQGPCTTRQCACRAAGSTGCAGDSYSCCSAVCDTSVYGYGVCR